jgi:2-hydroxychromene-2-carboxylate isomerase
LLKLTKAIFKAEWQDEKDISDTATLMEVVTQAGFDSTVLLAQAQTDAIEEEYRRYTEQAIAAGAFGSPSYVYEGELFWGQDRLVFLDEAIGSN